MNILGCTTGMQVSLFVSFVLKCDQLGLLKDCDGSPFTRGFNNWKKALEKFSKHESSQVHRDAVHSWRNYTKSLSVLAQISRQKQQEQQGARSCLTTIITSLLFLAKQGLAFRGRDNHGGNFEELMRLRAIFQI
eukprot:Pompholyxophrys_punicea_v1_NODE_861_length_1198_cov_7.663167.p1 type:complete len:134 gc:universal NODE_861_length_1198_cov_7.663167:887-486(-)